MEFGYDFLVMKRITTKYDGYDDCDNKRDWAIWQ